jgi:hypothetical protein
MIGSGTQEYMRGPESWRSIRERGAKVARSSGHWSKKICKTYGQVPAIFAVVQCPYVEKFYIFGKCPVRIASRSPFATSNLQSAGSLFAFFPRDARWHQVVSQTMKPTTTYVSRKICGFGSDFLNCVSFMLSQNVSLIRC